ncbi:ATP-dependent helicase [Nocardioides marmoribigeumensis]|uniref:DNA 3'-5' helicase n=1 Tax=Nocardioides marmoribigeumensis TaxID=433649 RepID=A0ABU2BTM2_9ACTN|nr:ATP-dependent DNA helicase [Nocardioides marmoribigeumensis]MDR7361641.1 superfamily I DNA/RNA helicase/RecB family exonuclease [Nocardioides marmoribigeumensis]
MTTYLLRRPARTAAPAPTLDASQQAVVEHAGGPLLVLAGPGTGKTTTMVEAVVDLVERRGVDPSEVLALTFSRKAAEQLRDRVTARLGRTTGSDLASTFHSFAWSLVKEWADPDAWAAPPRLLSAPVQDVTIRELLEPTPEAVRWPESLQEAVRTRGFSREVQSLLARARERGLTGPDLARLGAERGRPEWVAAGRFLEQYLTVLDAKGAVDYADLIVQAGGLADRPDVRRALRQRWSWVFVDEYQDTDPSQVALLRSIAGDGRNLVVVGDPDQSIYGFRGADVRGILDFPDRFRDLDGRPAPVLALQTTRRFGPRLLAASRTVAQALPTHGAIPGEAFRSFRTPRPAPGAFGDGEVEVLHFDTARAEVEHTADRLRRAHLEDGIGWSEMAVLVRSGRTAIPGLRRALLAAGVPVEVASDDTPLVDEPAVRPLLDALRAAVDLTVTDPASPSYLDAGRVAGLLMSPLGGLDVTGLRSLAKQLRHREHASGVAARSGDELVREALADPRQLDGLEGPAVERARSLGVLLAAAHARVAAGESAEQVLWHLWSGTDWPRRLRAVAVGGGGGSAAAHRDLDAICALFDEASSVEDQRDRTTAQTFLETLAAQQIPGDTLADAGVRGEAVRLLTAHRSKGLEWRLVVVHGVQEGTWPDLRRRSTLLHVEEVGLDPVAPGVPAFDVRALLAEERRLFYVACTRARQRLLVTAVASPDDDGDQPSRFTAELGVEARAVVGRPVRPLSLDGLVADLRRTAADESRSPALREAAVRRLARLAQERVGERPVAPAADPASWWGVRGRSRASTPVRPEDRPVALSASALEGLQRCPAQWFLEREAGGRNATTQAQGFGKVVHTIVDRYVKGEIDPDVSVDALMAHVDAVWQQIQFRTPWSGPRERAEARAALERFLTWSRRPSARRVVAAEQGFTVELTVGGERVRLRGAADRLEVDEDGRVVVIDFKTGKYPPPDNKIPDNPQLGVYQLAVDHGGFDELLGTRGASGGAELVHLRVGAGKGAAHAPKVQQQDPQAPGDDGLRVVERQLAAAARLVRDEDFPATPGSHCERCEFRRLCPAQNRGTVLS